MFLSTSELNRLCHRPGVYIYRDRTGAVLYVGKARDLSKRVRQYFHRDDAVGEKTSRLVSQIFSIEVLPTPTEFDALLLEAELIRKYLPKYNVAARDDKSSLYIVITLEEPLPRILKLRKTQLQQAFQGDPLQMASKRAIFGPFQSARVARDLLYTIRHIIPFCTQKQRTGRPCFYTHLGLCDPCPASILTKEDSLRYRKNIFRIRDILSGKARRVLAQLQKEMEEEAARQRFEEAQRLKNQLEALIRLQEKRFDPTLYTEKGTIMGADCEEELNSLRLLLHPHFPKLTRLSRIECIDVSNLSGRQAGGSLVVLSNGVPDTSQYRRFRIKTNPPAGGPNDVAMIQEVLTRRLHHPDWPYPDLLVIDGGKPQVAGAVDVLTKSALQIPVIGLAKRFEEIIVPRGSQFQTIRLPLTNPAIHLLQRVRDEAHRFAKSYHTLLRKKLLAQWPSATIKT